MVKPQCLRLEEVLPHNWSFKSSGAMAVFCKLERTESFDDAGDTEKAIQTCLEIIDACAEYLPAINKLGLLYRQQEGPHAAINVFESAVGVRLSCLPKTFQPGIDLISWDWPDNRAFLLACEQLASCHLESALNFFEYWLKINPSYNSIDKLVEQLRDVCWSKRTLSS